MLYDRLDYVLAIAEERNLTRAAKRLYISQPALTLYLNKLEAELGVKLFDRSRSPLDITDAGLFYIEKMKPLYYAEQALRNEIKMVAVPERTLSIGIGQVRGHIWLPLLLPEFCRLYPNINLEIAQTVDTNVVRLLKMGTVDVAFGVLPLLPDNIRTVDLLYDTLFFTATKNYGFIPADRRDEFSPEHPFQIEAEKLNQQPFIRTYVGNGLYSSFERIITDNNITPSRLISVSNLRTGFSLAMNGLGVQLLYSAVLSSEEFTKSSFVHMDFFVLEHMPVARKCIAAYREDNVKQDLIHSAIEIVKNKIIPTSKFMIPCD